MIYRSCTSALVFAGLALLIVAFLIFGPLRDAPSWVKFIIIPAGAVYVWATKP